MRMEEQHGANWEGLLLVQRAQSFQKIFCFFELRKQLFFLLKGRGMHDAPTAAELDGMTQVQHLMIDKILNGIARNARGIKNAAYDNSVMRGIIMAKAAQSFVAAPGHLRSSHEAVEETKIQLVKNLIEIIVLALGTLNALASA